MSKAWKRVLILFVIALICWYVEIVISPQNFELIFGIAAITFSVLCVCFLVIAIIRQRDPKASGYKIFAWVDILIGIGVTIYAIYDIQTDTGWFAGLLGMLLLIIVLPVILLLLILDFLLYMREKKQNK